MTTQDPPSSAPAPSATAATPAAGNRAVLRRLWVVGWSLTLALLVIGLASVSLGDAGAFDSTPWRVIRELFVALGLVGGDASTSVHRVLVDFRLPATLVAMLSGAALATAGVLTQGIFRNALAAPSVIGVTAGGGLGGVVSILLGSPVWQQVSGFVPELLMTPMFAFAGAVATAFLVFALATRHGETHVPTLLLAGIAVTGLVGALVSVLLALSLDRFQVFQQMYLWQMGGFEYRGWTHVLLLAPPVVLGVAGALMYARELNMLALGERSAAALGVNVQAVKRNCLILAALLAASTVSVIGMVGFVGLVVPHILRLILGPDHRVLVPACVLGGGAFLALMNLLQRLVCVRWLARPELRIGALMGLIGGAFFVWLLLRDRGRLARQ